MKKLLKITFTLIFTTIIVLGFAVPVNPPNGTWQQQFMPDLHGAVIKDITFTDSLTGYAVTNLDSFSTAYILKTTNGGNTWFNSLTDNVGFTKVQFLNNTTGYVSRLFTPPGFSLIYKTVNAGTNWFTINTAGLPLGMHVLSIDTIWMAGGDFNMGIYRTINGGINWQWQYNSPTINRIFMYNGRFGFAADGTQLYRTTNSGVNWLAVPGGGFIDIHFIDTLTGWKANVDMKKTTDGGLNWVTQTLPSGGIITGSSVQSISVLNKDTVWGSGGGVNFGGNRFRGILYRTINGGNNWLFQIPDTSIAIAGYYKVQFLNKNIGWASGIRANSSLYSNIHTTNGGDTTFIVGLQQISNNVPKDFILKQNYPNPFNPATNIKYSIKRETSNVKIIIFDVTGREIITLVNAEQQAGTYVVDFDGSKYSSGVYFYTLIADGINTDTKKMIMLK